MDPIDIQDLLLRNDSLFNHLHVVEQKFDIIPTKKHIGMAVNYTDIYPQRRGFICELVNTAVDWVYGRAKQEDIRQQLAKEGRSLGVASTELVRSAHSKFRKSENANLLNGQFGELLLSNCIQRFMSAVPVLRKMPIATDAMHERFGADAIHYKKSGDTHAFYLGEAKSYKSPYRFNAAFEDALTSILDTYASLDTELRSYLYEDFIEPELQTVVDQLVCGTLRNTKINLVSIVAYNETKEITGECEADIKKCIETIIRDRFLGFDNNKIKLRENVILGRITYIVFPIWEFDKLLEEFASLIMK